MRSSSHNEIHDHRQYIIIIIIIINTVQWWNNLLLFIYTRFNNKAVHDGYPENTYFKVFYFTLSKQHCRIVNVLLFTKHFQRLALSQYQRLDDTVKYHWNNLRATFLAHYNNNRCYYVDVEKVHSGRLQPKHHIEDFYASFVGFGTRL